MLPSLMLARKLWAYGEGVTYFDDAMCVGFVRAGLDGDETSRGERMAVVLNIGPTSARKRMSVGVRDRGRIFTDLLELAREEVKIDGQGWGEFPVGLRSVGVWLDSRAIGRSEVEKFR